MPLTMVQTGKETTVLEIQGKDRIRRFLAGLGFLEGGTVTVISELGGNLIVHVQNTRVALSKGMASRIMVR